MKRRLFQTILSFTLIFCVVGANVSAATLAENTNASQNGNNRVSVKWRLYCHYNSG